MFPPEPSCLNNQAMPTLKHKPPAKRLTISELHAKLINVHDNHFFVASEKEWRLVGVAYKDTMSLHPDCLQDSKCLVDYYILHLKDYWFGAPNQHFCLEYHQPDSSPFTRRKSSYHLIQPTRESDPPSTRMVSQLSIHCTPLSTLPHPSLRYRS